MVIVGRLWSGFYQLLQHANRTQPHFIGRKDGEFMAFAGLWERWAGNGERIESGTILTTEANELVKDIHVRMPVILRPDDFELWLEPDVQDFGSLKDLLVPYPDDDIEAYSVSRAVGNPRAQGPELVEPIAG